MVVEWHLIHHSTKWPPQDHFCHRTTCVVAPFLGERLAVAAMDSALVLQQVASFAAIDSAVISRTLTARGWKEHRAKLAQLWQLMVRYIVSERPDRDDPVKQAVIAHINSWHSTPWLHNVAP